MNKEKKRFLIISIILIIILTLLVLVEKTYSLDYRLFSEIHNLTNYDLTTFFKFIGDLGIIIGILLTISISLLELPRKIIFQSLTNIIGIAVLNKTIKLIIRRPRPSWMLIEIGGYSYPSAHTMLAFMIYGYLIYLTKNYVKKPMLRKIIYLGCGFMIALIGLSRIYLGVHYASDVLAAYIITFIYLLIITDVNQQILTKSQTRH